MSVQTKRKTVILNQSDFKSKEHWYSLLKHLGVPYKPETEGQLGYGHSITVELIDHE